MVQQLKIQLFLQRTSDTNGDIQQSITPIPWDIIPSSGLCMFQAPK